MDYNHSLTDFFNNNGFEAFAKTYHPLPNGDLRTVGFNIEEENFNLINSPFLIKLYDFLEKSATEEVYLFIRKDNIDTSQSQIDIKFYSKVFILKNRRFGILYKLDFNRVNWDDIYLVTFNYFLQVLALEAKEFSIGFSQDTDNYSNSYTLTFNLDPNSIININENIKSTEKQVEELLRKVFNKIKTHKPHHVVTETFQFPDQTKTVCKQYLVYFGQFLEDIGIEADVSVEEQLNSTLFTVIPKNKSEALEKIREALGIYLELPNSKNSILPVSQADIGVVQLQSNILHLQSQLLLQNSIIQLKDTTIQELQIKNFNLIEKHLQERSNDEETLAGGIIKVTEYEGKGIKINFAELFRLIKRKFKQ